MTLTAEKTPEQIDPAFEKARRMQRLMDASSFGTDDAKEAQIEGARLLNEFNDPELGDLDDVSEIEERLGRQAEDGGDLLAAESHYLSAVRQSRTRPRVMRLALLYLQTGQVDRGVPYLVSAIDGNTRVGAPFLLATIIFDAGDNQASDFLAALGRSRLDVRTQSKLNRLDVQPPRRALKAARDEGDGRALFLSGCSLHLQRNYRDAYLFYSAAMKLGHPMGLIGVGALARRADEWAKPTVSALPGAAVRGVLKRWTKVSPAEQKQGLEDSARREPDLVNLDVAPRDGSVGRGADPREIEQLVSDVLKLNARAVYDLLRIIQPLILSYCRARLGVNDWVGASADDVAQETCLAVIKALPSYEQDERPFLAFVYGIASHKVVDAHRRYGRTRSEPVAEVPDVVSPEDGPEEQAIQSASRSSDANRVGRLLEQLPEKQREILTLRVVVGLSAEETAEAVGATAGAVRVAQHRALTKLRRLLEAEGFADESAWGRAPTPTSSASGRRVWSRGNRGRAAG